MPGHGIIEAASRGSVVVSDIWLEETRWFRPVGDFQYPMPICACFRRGAEHFCGGPKKEPMRIRRCAAESVPRQLVAR